MIPTPDEILLDAQYDCPDIDAKINQYVPLRSWVGKPIKFQVGIGRQGFHDHTFGQIQVRLQEMGWKLSIDSYELSHIKYYPFYKLDRYYPPTRLATKISMIWKILTNRF